jgi:formylmethanofuran dehydrogenase subunit E
MKQQLEDLFSLERIKECAEARVCFECGEEVQGTMYHIGGEDYICEDCRDQYYYVCEDCDELVHEDNIVTVDGNRYVCWSCANGYYTCDHCHELFDLDNIAVDTYYITLCTECYEEDYFTCAGCGEIYRLEDSEFVDGCLYCRSCADSYTCILSYGTKPTPVFFGGGKVGYGVELEIDNGSNRQDAAWDIRAAGKDHIYLKEDGSLTCDGFEIVTHPATLDYHVNCFPWEDICRTALSYGYRSHDTSTCGLHIHASRDLFGVTQIEQDLTIAKIMLLIDRWYDSYIVQFARRDLAKMRQWADKPNAGIQPEDEDYDAVQKSKKLVGDRYRAVNLCNRHTVEFRFFRGTLKRDTIIASIQWVDTIIQYCRKTQLQDLFKVTWEDIFGNTGHVELTKYLRQRNLYNAKEDN